MGNKKTYIFLYSFLNFFKKEPKGGHRQQYGDCQRKERVGGGRRGKGRLNGDGRRLDLGW